LKKTLCLICLFLLLFTWGCQWLEASLPQNQDENESETEPRDNQTESGELSVHVLDVGQGDSILIALPGNRCMLIDAGNVSNGKDIVSYIASLGYTKIEYLVATHPHADHIGGMQTVVDSFDIGQVYMPRVSTNTQIFENLLLAIKQKGLTITAAGAGVNILEEEGLSLHMVAPKSAKYSSMNNYSAVVYIRYGSKAFLLMGDAETVSEHEMPGDMRADVVKVGHHGSNSASSTEFITRTQASFAVISVGKGNSYDHPAASVIATWQDGGTTVYRTDVNGTVVFTCDGKNLSVKTQK
jgi:beta-lactamase superfamily II metal-dependent hydrolase